MNLPNFLQVPLGRAWPCVTLNGRDITSQLEPDLLSFTYRDEVSGKGDSVDFELEDKERTWIDENFPIKGAQIESFIQVANWPVFPGRNLEQPCGKMTIDCVNFKLAPNTVSVKACSIPTNTKIKGTNTTRAWENTTLRDVASQICEENDLSCEWESKEEIPQYKRLEQMDCSDLAFLQNYADECGLAMKVADKKIVFFDEEDYEAREPVDTIRYGRDNVLRGSFSTKLTDTVKKVTTSYQNPETGQLTQEDFSLKVSKEEADLISAIMGANEINDHNHPGYSSDASAAGGLGAALRFAPLAEVARRASLEGLVSGWTNPDPVQQKGKGAGGKKTAGRRAKKLARKANKQGNTAELSLVGNPLLCAGKTVALEEFGRFSGKWIIETATHKLGRSGYTTDIKLTKTLEGY